MGFVDDDLVELDGGVHPPDVGVVPEEKRDTFNRKFTTLRENAALNRSSALTA